MTPPAGPEEAREPDFERVAEIVRNQLSGAGAGCKCNGCMIARAYVALQARQLPREPTDEMLQGACDEHKVGQPMSKTDERECPHIATRRLIWQRMWDAAESSRLAKLEQERGRGEG